MTTETKTQVYLRPLGKRKAEGSLLDAQTGDLVMFFEDQQHLTREVLRLDVAGKMVVTKPLMNGPYKIANSSLVRWDDIDEILRMEGVEMTQPIPVPRDRAPKVPPPPKVKAAPKPVPVEVPKPPKVKAIEIAPVVGVRAPGAALRPGDPGYASSPVARK